MLKILSAEQIRQADAETIKNEPVSSIDLMERAAEKAFESIMTHFHSDAYTVFCGPGNNGGDGLVIARLLVKAGKTVLVYILKASAYSDDFLVNKKRADDSGIKLFAIEDDAGIPEVQGKIVIDALFGTGLSRPLTGIAASLVKYINRQEARIISIDMPSGMYADKMNDGDVIKADATITFQLPKLSFLFPETGINTGTIYIVDIGIDTGFLESAETKNYMLQADDISRILKKRERFSHKGTFGHALILAGSTGRTGAAILCAKACLRSGAGAVTMGMNSSGMIAMNAALPEAMTINCGSEKVDLLPDLAPFDTVACGPGLGKDEDTARVIKMLIQNSNAPLIFDADALNILSENPTWFSFMHPGSILTPHPKEFERLAGKTTDSLERMEVQIRFAKKYQCYLILKGHHTCIATPDGKCYFNSTGNSGMATAGSGDVLTGILAALLAQGYSSKNAALAGVYIHGKAGDIAAAEVGETSLIASDIIDHIPDAIRFCSI